MTVIPLPLSPVCAVDDAPGILTAIAPRFPDLVAAWRAFVASLSDDERERVLISVQQIDNELPTTWAAAEISLFMRLYAGQP